MVSDGKHEMYEKSDGSLTHLSIRLTMIDQSMEAWLHGCKAWEAGIRIAQQVCGNQQNTHSRKHEKVAWTGISVGWITRVQNYSRRSQVMLHAILFAKIIKK